MPTVEVDMSPYNSVRMMNTLRRPHAQHIGHPILLDLARIPLPKGLVQDNGNL